LDAVFLDIGRSVFTDGMAYVALSRARAFERVFIVDFDYTKIKCNRLAYAEYNRLRKTINLPQLPECNHLPTIEQLQMPQTQLADTIETHATEKKKKMFSKQPRTRGKPACTIAFMNIEGSNDNACGYVKCCMQLLMQVGDFHRYLQLFAIN
jgi:hypothetical protein